MEETSKNNKFCQCQYETDNNLPASQTCYMYCPYHPCAIAIREKIKEAFKRIKKKENTNE